MSVSFSVINNVFYSLHLSSGKDPLISLVRRQKLGTHTYVTQRLNLST